ncbi:MAG: hypothetical protein HQ515_09655, partial [Phycisphaeraceae bacterium]|nr:hypothetical protein [Phycisphaeraceae bacterium]
MDKSMWHCTVVLFMFVTSACLMDVPVYAESSDFYAHYTRLAYDDDNNTGKYADIVVTLGHTGQLVFSREYSYLPFWRVSEEKHFVDRIIPFVGDGPAERPDKINKCSYVRIVENTPDKITVHWRYAPDQRRDSFTRFRETYGGDIGQYHTEYCDEYFTIKTDGTVLRRLKKGCYRLDDWNDPANAITQTLQLTSTGITVKKTTPAALQHLPGEPVQGLPVIEESSQPPALWMRFDEGLKPNGHSTQDSVRGTQCAINGMDSYWRAGVSGTCLSFDGYTNKV